MSKLGGVIPVPDKRDELLAVQREFVIAVEDIVERETETWIMEFKTSLAELASTYRKKNLVEPTPEPRGIRKPKARSAWLPFAAMPMDYMPPTSTANSSRP